MGLPNNLRLNVSNPNVPRCAKSPYIFSGYRPRLTFMQGVLSTLHWHNETVNILSHLIPSFGFVVYALFISNTDTLAFSCAITIFAALLASAVFHMTCSCPKRYYTALTCDNIGLISIIGLCGGSHVYNLSSRISHHACAWHMFLFCVTLLVACYYVVGSAVRKSCSRLDADELVKNGIDPVYAVRGNYLAFVFVLISMTYWIFPVLHIATFNYELAWHSASIIMVDWVMWLVSFVIYALQFPEKRFPGMFDYLGNSHNIFHFWIVASDITYMVCMHRLYNLKV
jgi:adiponectin receptor